jgi:hypothetical protein
MRRTPLEWHVGFPYLPIGRITLRSVPNSLGLLFEPLHDRLDCLRLVGTRLGEPRAAPFKGLHPDPDASGPRIGHLLLRNVEGEDGICELRIPSELVLRFLARFE